MPKIGYVQTRLLHEAAQHRGPIATGAIFSDPRELHAARRLERLELGDVHIRPVTHDYRFVINDKGLQLVAFHTGCSRRRGPNRDVNRLRSKLAKAADRERVLAERVSKAESDLAAARLKRRAAAYALTLAQKGVGLGSVA